MNAVQDWTVPVAGTLRDGLVTLDRGYHIALVVDESGRLLGTLTDGDVRRAILRGATLDAPLSAFMHRQSTTVGPQAGRAEVLDLMRALTISGIPIVDDAGRVLGLHLMREIVGGRERASWAVVMAGGSGSRLGAVTQAVPKPMVNVAGRPILERIVLHLVGCGVRRIFLAVHHLGHVIEDHFGDGHRFGARIEYLREPEPRGSGGALAFLPETPGAPLLVMNGDLVTQADLGAMLDQHQREGNRATVGVRVYQHAVPFGCVEVAGSRVVAMEEKPVLARLVNAGIYVVDPDLPARVPRGEASTMPQLLERSLAAGERVGAFGIEGDWIDVGVPDQLAAARGLR